MVEWWVTAPTSPQTALRLIVDMEPDLLSALSDLRPRIYSETELWRLVWPTPQNDMARRVEAALSERLSAPEILDPGDVPAEMPWLGAAAVRYLSDPDYFDDSPAEPASPHLLLMRLGALSDIVGELTKIAARHGTGYRLAQARVRGHPTLLLKVRYDDAPRISSLEPLEAAGLLRNAVVLRPYSAGREARYAYLSRPPAAAALEAVMRLYAAAPGVFAEELAQGPTAAHDQALFAVDRNELVDLRSVRFVGPAVLQSGDARPAAMRISAADPEGGLQELRDTMRDPAAAMGAALRLRRAETELEDKIELSRVIRELERLRRLRARLEKKVPINDRLVRVPGRELKALSDLLRGFHAEDLASGSVKYARCMSADARGGVDAEILDHYLLFDQNRSPNDRSDRAPAPPAEAMARRAFQAAEWFEPDRILRTYYDNAATRVFVPRRTVLHPTPHSFRIEEFDGFMADALARWRGDADDDPTDDGRERAGAQTETVVLFEQRGSEDRRLVVTAIPVAAFQPLRIEAVQWLNDVQFVSAVSPDWALLESPGRVAMGASASAALEREASSRAEEATRALDLARGQVIDETERFLDQIVAHAEGMSEVALAKRDRFAAITKEIAGLSAQYARIEGAFDAMKREDAAVAQAAETAAEGTEETARGSVERANELATYIARREDEVLRILADLEKRLAGLRARLRKPL